MAQNVAREFTWMLGRSIAWQGLYKEGHGYCSAVLEDVADYGIWI
jgi:hypothetical protein